jgi:hypothetical protein
VAPRKQASRPFKGERLFLYLLREASDLKNRNWEVNKYVYYVMEVAPRGRVEKLACKPKVKGGKNGKSNVFS